ncbi:MAG TPA: MBL fold metallo-hydrolase [Planctomycetota bacterium]|nr:MBL fold metallo-hydrolase [Planctomycetota bacterium]
MRGVVLSLYLGLCGLGAHRALAPRDPAERVLRAGTSLAEFARAHPPEASGTFPESWIHGADCASDPPLQVHAYNQDLFILRQSKCATTEAPFVFLVFGEERALLLDTGATRDGPLWATVEGLVSDWLERREQGFVELIVAHSHSHGDHVAGDPQFVGRELVSTVVTLERPGVLEFWGFEDYPLDAATIDLGGRVLDVLGTPGHKDDSVTLYDRRTHLLLTGDLVYPGHLFVFTPEEWPDFLDSLRRLVAFAAEHPVEWVVGCHVEMGAEARASFAYGTQRQDGEHALQLSPDVLLRVLEAALKMGDTPRCEIFDEFVIHPVWAGGISWNG